MSTTKAKSISKVMSEKYINSKAYQKEQIRQVRRIVKMNLISESYKNNFDELFSLPQEDFITTAPK